MTKPLWITMPDGRRADINHPIYYMPPYKKPVPTKPAPDECHCAYEEYVMELNVDRLDIPTQAYVDIKKHCPVCGVK